MTKEYFLGLAALLLLAVMIGTSPSELRYDEPYHLSVAANVIDSTWREALLNPKNPSAAGPLFAAVHVMLHPLTQLQAPSVRWINFCLLLVIIVIVASSVGGIGQLKWRAGLGLLSVPFIWPCVGMALTEIPALVAFCIYIYCFLMLLKESVSSPLQIKWSLYAWATSAGLALGVSILGRQTYLIVLPCVLVIGFLKLRFWRFGLITFVIAVLVSIWPFLIWKGLVPPSQQYTDSGLRWQNLMLSLTYITAATILLRPSWINARSVLLTAIALLLGFVLTWVSRDYNTPPAKSLLLNLFGERAGLLLGFLAGSALGSLSILWLIETVRRAWRERSDVGRMFLYVTLLALIIAPLKVSHLFSSRYVVGALGVLVLLLFDDKRERFDSARFLVGGAIGALSLYTYLYR